MCCEKMKKNPFIQNLNRIEVIITFACTGHCKHCSEGDHKKDGAYYDGDTVSEVIRNICENFQIKSFMTFGGEPLLHPNEVYKTHTAAQQMGIPKRQLITNGFFNREESQIKETVSKLAQSGVNDILLSIDAFHQETIPLGPVLTFAEEVKKRGIPLRVHPAWLVGEDAVNPYNNRTRQFLENFTSMGIGISKGNVVFPSGNALRYLSDYFNRKQEYVNPYQTIQKIFVLFVFLLMGMF